jgi:hypothetical protein
MQTAGALAGALQDMLRQMIEKVLGAPSKGKGGEPLDHVVYMLMPSGFPIDPRDFSYAWDPAGSDSSSDVQDDGKMGTKPLLSGQASSAPPADGSAPPVEDKKLEHALASARNIATYFDQMLQITDNGTYAISTNSGGSISKAYEGIITKGQGIPAPPLPPDIQKQVDAAMRVLYVYDDAGNQTGKTKAFKNYEQLKQAYADAEASYANAYSAAMTNASLGQTWPVASKSYKAAVDNAYDDWRSANAENIENALETVKSIGGSIGDHFLAQARNLYDAWSLGLSGSVAVGTPYTQVMPGSWWDPNDKEKGFTTTSASASQFQSNSHAQAAQAASSWYNGQSSSTGGSAGFSAFGFSIGGGASHSSADQHSGADASGSQSFSFSNSMSNVTIKFSYGLCNIYRPWLLKEIFSIDGWYLPGAATNVVSDGTIAGQKSQNDKHLLPMIPTQFLVIENVSITASGWGNAGTQLSNYVKHAQSDSQSSSTSVNGSVGFMGFGGSVSHSNADWSGDTSATGSSAQSWYFSGDSQYGTLTINGGQVVGFIGEIIPASPQVDGTKQTATAKPAASGTTTTGSTASTGAATTGAGATTAKK